MIGGWQQVVAVRVVAVVVRVDQGAERSIGDRADGVEKSAGPLLREARVDGRHAVGADEEAAVVQPQLPSSWT